MPYAKAKCTACGCDYQPKSRNASRRGLCWPCALKGASPLPDMPPRSRDCEVCGRAFVVPVTCPAQARCTDCLKVAAATPDNQYAQWAPGEALPVERTHSLAPPMRQAVFDLETFALDRGWGVLMVASVLVHDGGGAKMHTFTLRDCGGWPKIRSNDSELGAMVLKVLSECHVAYAHNGRNYDVPWLNSIALKYAMPRLHIKLVDPVQVARQKYRIGSNSLSALASFLGLDEAKMPVPAEVWRTALMDDDDASWQTLRERCESDVRLLNEVAARVVGDVGMIDYNGSAWR